MTIPNNLADIVKFAYDTVPYYRKAYGGLICETRNALTVDDYLSLPIMHKTDISGVLNHISKEFKNDYASGKLTQKFTSGSTGRCLKVIWTLCDDIYANKCAWALRERWYHIAPKDNYLGFHTTTYIGNRMDKQREIIRQGTILSLNKHSIADGNMDEYFSQIKTHAPVWIIAQPSVMSLLCGYMQKNSVNLKTVKYIELTGEYLQESVRDYIQQVFPAAKIANMYGAIEVGVISLQCPHGRSHLLESNVFIEAVNKGKTDAPEDEGEAVVTSLRNTAMPFIRYFLGDRVRILRDISCPCGHTSHCIEVIAGRTHDNISLPAGRKASPYILLMPIEIINGEFNSPVIQFQVIQHEIGIFEVDMELKPDFHEWRETIRTKFLSVLSGTVLKDAKWEINFPERILLDERSGKVSFFRNMIG